MSKAFYILLTKKILSSVAKTLLTHTDVTVYYNSSLGFLLLDADFLLPGMAGLGC